MCAAIFVSFCQRDQQRLKALVKELDKSAHRFWIAWRDIAPADDFVRYISETLAKCTHMIVAWSKNAAASTHVQNEYYAFYGLNPKAGNLLFLCIDDAKFTEPLFMTRQRLNWTMEPPKEIADRIIEWLDSNNAPETDDLIESASIEDPLRLISTVRVPFYEIKPQLIEEFAEIASDYVRAIAVLGHAISIIKSNDPKATYVRSIYLPGKDAPILSIWQAIFDEACKHGARMVAALLYALPDDHFSVEARRARSELLASLRAL